LLAGFVAAGLGLGLAICAGRAPSLRRVLFAGLVVVLVLPPALGALGTILVASGAPAWLDPVVRSRSTVGAVLGLRLVPVPAILFVRALGGMPASWALAASVHGVGLGRYGLRVLLPFLAPTFGLAVLLVALLATADVGTVLLLQPPGEDSLPVSIFTVMANAPGSLVAALCLAYVATAGAAIVLVGLAIRILGGHRLPGGAHPGSTVRR
jgi:iron(III) transport system permease protein